MTSPSTTKTNPPTAAVIAAAGQGTRLGADVPKAYVELAGKTLLERSVAAMVAAGVDQIVVAVSADMEDTARRLLRDYDVTFAHGRGERADSVWAGLQAVRFDSGVVVVHDAARALTPPALIRAVIDGVRAGAPAVIPVLPVADTIKRVEAGRVVETPDRASLRAVQTPQGFDIVTLRAANRAYFAADTAFTATDDASLMEWRGQPVTCVDGDPLALKITTPADLLLARAILDNQH